MEHDNHMLYGGGPFDKRCSHDKTILWCKAYDTECQDKRCIALDDEIADCPELYEKCEICGGEL